MPNNFVVSRVSEFSAGQSRYFDITDFNAGKRRKRACVLSDRLNLRLVPNDEVAGKGDVHFAWGAVELKATRPDDFFDLWEKSGLNPFWLIDRLGWNRETRGA